MRIQITERGISTDDDKGEHPVGAIIDVPGEVMPAKFVNKAIIVASPGDTKAEDKAEDKPEGKAGTKSGKQKG